MFAVQCGCEAPRELRSPDEMEVKKDAGMHSIVFAQFSNDSYG